jgi:hypothetical protein
VGSVHTKVGAQASLTLMNAGKRPSQTSSLARRAGVEGPTTRTHLPPEGRDQVLNEECDSSFAEGIKRAKENGEEVLAGGRLIGQYSACRRTDGTREKGSLTHC